MSRIESLGKKLEKLPGILREYEDEIENVKSILSIKGKTLKVCNRDAEHQFFYDEKRKELSTLVKYMDAKVNATRGRLYRAFTENSPRELSDRARDKYIDNEHDYLIMYELYLEVKELYEKYEAIVDAFRSRGYAINNLTKLVTNNVEDYIV
jgi:cell fate (sporulation/competence/biofilm development) regulator YmcA (YheA/YmcA/DUF963 family)